MHPIKEQQWKEVSIYTWEELEPHLWEDFRIALMELKSELTAQGVDVEQSMVSMATEIEVDVQGVRIEYSPVVLKTNTEMIVSIVVSERDYKTEMIKYLPLYERKSNTFNEVITANDREFRNLEQQLEVAERNIFVDTAIESLPIFERDLGIKSNKNLRYDQRREQIESRNRASIEQTTESSIKNVAAAFSNGEVDVDKTDVPGVYEIKFVGTIGIPNNMEGLKQVLDIIMPAHLELTYTFIFNVWDNVSNLTWRAANSMTWDDLRTWNEVS